MSANSRLLNMLLIFIGGTIGAAAGAGMGTPIAILGGVFGSACGWVAGRWLMRKLF